jgi:hypothetical protein
MTRDKRQPGIVAHKDYYMYSSAQVLVRQMENIPGEENKALQLVETGRFAADSVLRRIKKIHQMVQAALLCFAIALMLGTGVNFAWIRGE